MVNWGKWSFIATVFLIGIPAAASFYPTLFVGFLGWLPLDIILPSMAVIGLISLGTAIGWYLHSWHVQGETVQTDQIVGCVKTDGVVWRGIATISQGEIEDIEVPYEALCPQCGTEMNSENTMVTNIRDPSKHQSRWKCPNSNCRHVTTWNSSDGAENIFKRHVRRIIQSENKEYSLNSLIDQIDGEATDKKIWRQYVSITKDGDLSTSCFH